jgi:glycosyltransferase involved in cell wall biosynthesis
VSSALPSSKQAAPTVSAVIPSYNYGTFVGKAIESVLSQSHPNVECIVVDDGSTDNTREVVARYGDRVHYIYQKNAGLPEARNTGVRAATGDFVGFLDADDEWEPKFVETALQYFEKMPADLGVVACRATQVGLDSKPLGLKRLLPEIDEELSLTDLIFRTRFFPSAVLARKSAVVEAGYFDPNYVSEDRDMWIRIAERHRVFLHGQRLVLIRKHATNMSKNAQSMKEKIKRTIVKSYRAYPQLRGRVFFWLHVWSFFYFQSGWTFYDQGKRLTAIGELLKSLALWPFYSKPKLVNEPALFRIRALAIFLLRKPTVT